MQQLGALYQWSQSRNNYGLAVSNPKFEFWLLLHFEDGNGVASSRECSDRLRRYLPNYEKGSFDVRQLGGRVRKAVQRAEMRDNPPCPDWPQIFGTTVYRLVRQIG